MNSYPAGAINQNNLFLQAALVMVFYHSGKVTKTPSDKHSQLCVLWSLYLAHHLALPPTPHSLLNLPCS